MGALIRAFTVFVFQGTLGTRLFTDLENNVFQKKLIKAEHDYMNITAYKPNAFNR